MLEEIDVMALEFRRKLKPAMPSFGKYVKLWREKAGLRKIELARHLGVSATHIGNLERDLSPSSKNGRPPLVSREMCDQLARVLQVPRHVVYLAAYVPELLELEKYDLRTKRMVAIFEELPEPRQDEVLAYLEMIWRLAVATPPSEPKDTPDKERITSILEKRK
jgi:transcriptional regulator with XRE-family HTH domain